MLKKIKNIKIETKKIREFGIIIGSIILVIVSMMFFKEKEFYKFLLYIGVFVFFSGLLLPNILKPFYWIWMLFSLIIGWFMTRIILSILFYTIITPTGLILRLFRINYLELNNNNKSSFWNNRDSQIEKSQDYEKQF